MSALPTYERQEGEQEQEPVSNDSLHHSEGSMVHQGSLEPLNKEHENRATSAVSVSDFVSLDQANEMAAHDEDAASSSSDVTSSIVTLADVISSSSSSEGTTSPLVATIPLVDQSEAEGSSSSSATSSSTLPDSSSESAAASSSISCLPSSTLFSAQPNNSAEAASALDIGRSFLDAGDLVRAERTLAKSVRLAPTTENMQLLASVQRRRKEKEGGREAGAASSVAAASSRPAAPAQPAASHIPHSSPPPPPPPSAAGAAAAPAAAGAGADEIEIGRLFSWRRGTLIAPSFLQPTPRPGMSPSLSWTVSYPSFLFIPPPQRRPLLIIWSIVIVLCLARLAGFMNSDDYPHGQRRGGRFHQQAQRYRQRNEQTTTNEEASSSGDGSTWTSSSYSVSRSPSASMLTFSNLLSLLPFLFFFAGPMWQRYRQQQQ